MRGKATEPLESDDHATGYEAHTRRSAIRAFDVEGASPSGSEAGLLEAKRERL